MRKILYIALLGLLTSSCSSTYFYSTLASTNTEIRQVENGDFMAENNDVWVAYSFKGENAPMRITVFNKSDEPLYINWQKSSLAFANQTYADKQSALAVDAFNLTDYTVYDIQGQPMDEVARDSNLPDYVSIIPPKTMVSHVPVRFNTITALGNLRKGTYTQSTLLDNKNQEQKVDEINFSDKNSPLKFKSSLTVYSQSGKSTTFEHEFYLSNLIKTNAIEPNSLNSTMAARGDLFYMEKQSDNSTLHVKSGTAVLAGSADVDVIVHQ